jgi:hypothetical protein
VTKGTNANTLSMDGKVFFVDPLNSAIYNTNPPPTPEVYNSKLQFYVKDMYINYSYVDFYNRFTRRDKYHYGKLIRK